MHSPDGRTLLYSHPSHGDVLLGHTTKKGEKFVVDHVSTRKVVRSKFDKTLRICSTVLMKLVPPSHHLKPWDTRLGLEGIPLPSLAHSTTLDGEPGEESEVEEPRCEDRGKLLFSLGLRAPRTKPFPLFKMSGYHAATSHPHTPYVQPAVSCTNQITRQYPSPWIGCRPPPIIQYAKPIVGYLAPTTRPDLATPQRPYWLNENNILSDTAPLAGSPTVVFPVQDNDAFPTDQSQGFWTQAKPYLAQ